MSHPFSRFTMNLQFILKGHILNPLWLPHAKRKEIRNNARQKARMKYLELYLDEVRDLKASKAGGNDEGGEQLFTLWLQGEEQAPDIVKACIRSMRRHVDLPLLVLDESTIFNWIDLPPHIMEKWRKGIITRTHFSDICRIELLYQHGGVWADATDYFTAPIPESVMKEDFFLFMAGEKNGLGTHAFIQSCFIRAKKGNPLLGMWREALFNYWKNEDSLIDYFTLHYLFHFLVRNNEKAAGLFAHMPKIDQTPTHNLFHWHKDDPYTPSSYAELTKDTFFQKTSYKSKGKGGMTPLSGSNWDFIIKS